MPRSHTGNVKNRESFAQAMGISGFVNGVSGLFFSHKPQKALPLYTKPREQYTPCEDANTCAFECCGGGRKNDAAGCFPKLF